MHILIIPPGRYLSDDKPNACIFQHHQAHALKKAGLKVGVIAPSPVSLRYLNAAGLKRKSIEIEIDCGIPVYRYQGYNWPTGMFERLYWRYWMQIAKNLFDRYVKENGPPDIIHAHNCLFPGEFAAHNLAGNNYKIVITEHSTIYHSKRLSAEKISRTRFAWHAAHGRIAVSPELGARLSSLCGASGAWDYIPNILDSQFEKQTPFSKRSETDFVFLNIGGLIKRKNQDGLLHAFAQSFRNNPKVKLRIGGQGPLRKKLEHLAYDLGISEKVAFLGYLNRRQTLSEMTQCDVFVFPSHYETFGVVLIEAASCGKPLVAFSGSGPDVIINKENGILVDEKTNLALSVALQRIYFQIKNYDSEHIRQDCLMRFSEDAVIRQLLSVYRSVLTIFSAKNKKGFR